MPEDLHILLTGDCWNAEISHCFANSPFTITFRSLAKVLEDPIVDDRWQLVVVASSRRGQFPAERVEQLLERFINVPVIGLAGSWCEGETRSGNPVPGLVRIYWHQWLGQLDKFFEQVRLHGCGTWHLPKIATTADRVLHTASHIPQPHSKGEGSLIGISALTRDRYSMLEDALASNGSHTIWLESVEARDTELFSLTAICIEGNSLSEQVCIRIEQHQTTFPGTPIILILNFPRQCDVEAAQRLGVRAVVSKPFQLADLQQAIERSAGVPAPEPIQKG